LTDVDDHDYLIVEFGLKYTNRESEYWSDANFSTANENLINQSALEISILEEPSTTL
jgi:hypothetical protein